MVRRNIGTRVRRARESMCLLGKHHPLGARGGGWDDPVWQAGVDGNILYRLATTCTHTQTRTLHTKSTNLQCSHSLARQFPSPSICPFALYISLTPSLSLFFLVILAVRAHTSPASAGTVSRHRFTPTASQKPPSFIRPLARALPLSISLSLSLSRAPIQFISRNRKLSGARD